MAHQRGGAMHNMSIDTDAQQQKAASPQVLVRRSSSRYASAGNVPAPANFAVLQSGLALQTP
jgi:hypothetical protein